MRRVIGGTAYNTATATKVAVLLDDAAAGITNTIYITPKGHFFVHTDYRETETISAITEAEVRKLIDDGADVLVPIDAATRAKGTTLLLRLSAPLKAKMEEKAQAAGISVNAWALQCLQRCAG